MAVQFSFAARSDVGKVRNKNDDSAYAGRYFAVVADGMGGHVGGDVASASVVLDLAPLDRPDHADPANVLADEIQSANLILNQLVHDNPKLAGMGTTCTALLVDENKLHLAHIGDSRAYRLKDGVFEQVTTDHTFVQRLINEGRIRPEEAETHPHKNVLMRVLGDVDASPELDLATFDTEPGERWLLCSDGLMAVVADDIIEEKLRHAPTLDDAVNELVELTLAGGSPDNVTIVVFETEERHDHGADDTGSFVPEIDPEELEAAEDDDQANISAALLRHDLSSRPHLLVGAAQLATDTDQIPIVTRSSTKKRAAMLLHGPDPVIQTVVGTPSSAGKFYGQTSGLSDDLDNFDDFHDLDSDEYRLHEQLEPRGRNWPILAVLSVILVLFVSGTVISSLWVRGQYYVGAEDGQVTVFRGLSQNLGPLSLSTVEERTDIPLSRLPGYTRERVEDGLPAQDLAHAQDILSDLEEALTPEAPPVDNDGADDAAPSVPMTNSGAASASIGGATAGAIGGND